MLFPFSELVSKTLLHLFVKNIPKKVIHLIMADGKRKILENVVFVTLGFGRSQKEMY